MNGRRWRKAAFRSRRADPRSSFHQDDYVEPAWRASTIAIYTDCGVLTRERPSRSIASSRRSEWVCGLKPGDLVIAATSENVADVGKAVTWPARADGLARTHEFATSSARSRSGVRLDFFTSSLFHAQRCRYVSETEGRCASRARESRDLDQDSHPARAVQERIVEVIGAVDDQITALDSEANAAGGSSTWCSRTVALALAEGDDRRGPAPWSEASRPCEPPMIRGNDYTPCCGCSTHGQSCRTGRRFTTEADHPSSCRTGSESGNRSAMWELPWTSESHRRMSRQGCRLVPRRASDVPTTLLLRVTGPGGSTHTCRHLGCGLTSQTTRRDQQVTN